MYLSAFCVCVRVYVRMSLLLRGCGSVGGCGRFCFLLFVRFRVFVAVGGRRRNAVDAGHGELAQGADPDGYTHLSLMPGPSAS